MTAGGGKGGQKSCRRHAGMALKKLANSHVFNVFRLLYLVVDFARKREREMKIQIISLFLAVSKCQDNLAGKIKVETCSVFDVDICKSGVPNYRPFQIKAI